MDISSLVDNILSSPNYAKRTAKIENIVIHHGGSANCKKAEVLGAKFLDPTSKASANYVVGWDGRIVNYLDESKQPYTTSNRSIDNKSVTIEVCNDGGAPDWHVSDESLEATIRLCADICQRNGIERLIYTGDKTGNLQMHKWYASTACPGPYLSSKFPCIAAEVNKRLGITEDANIGAGETVTTDTISEGDVISLVPGTRYITGKEVPSWVLKMTLYARKIIGECVTFSIFKAGPITGTVPRMYVLREGVTTAEPEIPVETPTVTTSACPYLVKTSGNLDIYAGAGAAYKVKQTIVKAGIYTIIKESNGFGKLKSGAGWVDLSKVRRV